MNTDPIADMLTRIRNAQMASITKLTLPNSKIKLAIAKIMQQQGYLSEVTPISTASFEQLQLVLNPEKEISSIKRVSKPGRRIYAKAKDIPFVLNGQGIMIVSTPAGIMSDREARSNGVGGELICEVS